MAYRGRQSQLRPSGKNSLPGAPWSTRLEKRLKLYCWRTRVLRLVLHPQRKLGLLKHHHASPCYCKRYGGLQAEFLEKVDATLKEIEKMAIYH